MNSGVAWALVFHIVGFVLWMGGLLVATQVMASRTRQSSPEVHAALARLETKLFKGIAHPGAAVTVIGGIIVLVLQPDYLRQGWLHAKLFLVAILIALDIIAYVRSRASQAGRIELQKRECMALHSGIALVFIGIVILVMIKPF
jgi:protoporphyrinogen IX oxidase